MKTPKVIKYKGRYFYKEINFYKYRTKPFNGYIGGYWTWELDEDNKLYKNWLFYTVELSDWLIERDMKDMLKHFQVNYE